MQRCEPGRWHTACLSCAQRVEISSLSIYWVVIHRFGELQYGAKAASLNFPFGKTNAECFKTFANLWNLTASRYNQTRPALGEGDTRSLVDIRDENLALCPSGLAEGQLITLFNGGIRNASGTRGPEVIATAKNASSFGENHCSPDQAGLPACPYVFTVLGHWVSAVVPTRSKSQWLEWAFNLRPGMGIGRVQALQLPSADGKVQHQLLFDGAVTHEWSRSLVVDATAVQPRPSFCQIVFSAIVNCSDSSNASTCVNNPPITWSRPSIKAGVSPDPANNHKLAKGCRRDLLFEYSPADGKSKVVSVARLRTTTSPGNWVAWSAVTFTMCPIASAQSAGGRLKEITSHWDGAAQTNYRSGKEASSTVDPRSKHDDVPHTARNGPNFSPNEAGVPVFVNMELSVKIGALLLLGATRVVAADGWYPPTPGAAQYLPYFDDPPMIACVRRSNSNRDAPSYHRMMQQQRCMPRSAHAGPQRCWGASSDVGRLLPTAMPHARAAAAAASASAADG